MLQRVCVLSVCHSSEEDDEEPLDWLPIAPEIEEPEDTGWGQLEVSEVHNTKTSLSCSTTTISCLLIDWYRSLYTAKICIIKS